MEANKKYYLLSAIYLCSTAIVIFLLFKFGISGAVGLSTFFQSRNQIVGGQNPSDNVVPVPQLLPITEATNSASLDISGFAQPNQKVDIYINDLNVKSFDVDSEGKFNGNINLSLGLSKIYAVAVSSENIQSSPSTPWTIFYNNSPPYLEILEPSNNSEFIRPNNNVVIKGKISPTSKVFINDHQIIVENERYFNYAVTLQRGENHFKIVSLDPALNKTELEWVLIYK